MEKHKSGIKRALTAAGALAAVLIIAYVATEISGFAGYIRSERMSDAGRELIGIPEDLECLYSKYEPSFHRDGWRYYVYRMPEDGAWLDTLHTRRDLDKEEFYASAVNALHISDEYQSDLEHTKYAWKYCESEDGLTRALAVCDGGRGYLYMVVFEA